MLGNTTAWRSTFESLKDRFLRAGERHPDLRHVIVQPLDGAPELPPSWQRTIKEAGGATSGLISPRSNLNPPLWMNPFGKVSYLYGPEEARRAFARLAGEAWVAVPGSAAGKVQHFPQERPLERWLQFMYDRLRGHTGTYLDMHGDHWVAFKKGRGAWQEKLCPPTLVRREYPDGRVMMETVYPDAEGLTGTVRRWRLWSLASDVFSAAAAAIDVWLAHPDQEGPYLVSWQEADAYQKSPEFQNANFALDYILLGEGRRFPIMRDWCIAVPGGRPSLCPNADPPADEKDRKALERYLPQIEGLYRAAGLLGEGQTIHWVGRQARLGTGCDCYTGAPARAVILRGRGDKPTVRGVEKPLLTDAQYDTVKALLEAQPKKLSKDELDKTSGRTDARKHLKKLAKDPDWAAVIDFPGAHGRDGYGLSG